MKNVLLIVRTGFSLLLFIFSLFMIGSTMFLFVTFAESVLPFIMPFSVKGFLLILRLLFGLGLLIYFILSVVTLIMRKKQGQDKNSVLVVVFFEYTGLFTMALAVFIEILYLLTLVNLLLSQGKPTLMQGAGYGIGFLFVFLLMVFLFLFGYRILQDPPLA